MRRVFDRMRDFFSVGKRRDNIWRATTGLVVLTLICTNISIIIRLSELAAEAKEISRAHFTLKLLGDLLGAAKDQEIGQRGYLLTKDPIFLEPKQLSDKRLPTLIDQLKRLSDEDPVQERRLQGLADLILRNVARVDAVIQASKERGLTSQEAAEQLRFGKSLMDEIRSRLVDMELSQSELLRDRLMAFEDNRQGGRYVAGGAVLTILLVVFLTWMFESVSRRNRVSLVREAASREEAEEALQHSRSRLRTALMHLPLRLYSIDKNGRYTWLQESVRDIGSNAIGKRDDELFNPDDVSELIGLQQEVLRSGKTARRTLRLPFSGEPCYYDVTIDPDLSKSGEITGVTVSAFDIQQQIDLQLVAEQRARDLMAIADTMPQLVWATDNTGKPDYFNLRWREYVGTEGDFSTDIGEKSFVRFIHPDDFPRVQSRWQRCLESGTPFEAECRIKNHVTGEYRWFMTRALPVKDEAGAVERWFGSCTDIHDQKVVSNEREEFLKSERAARKEVEHVMASKEDYIATLTHELRGPLNSILGWTQLLRSKSKNPDMALIFRAIDLIEQNARNQSQLVSDLFEMQKINAGKIELDLHRVSITTLVAEVCENLMPVFSEKKIRLIHEIGATESFVEGDRIRLTQVLTNLLNNSLKFSTANGTVAVSVREIRDSVQIQVKDDGMGISPDVIPLMFERYKQGHLSKSQKQGVGLGLAIAKSIVHLHAGSIDGASPGVGKGSTFTILLPKALPQANSFDSPRKLSPLLENGQLLFQKKILLVEDQDDARDALARILEGQGAEVGAVGSAQAALAILKDNIPDIIISDISMPEMDGYAMIKEIHRIYGRVPAIALTAFAREEDRRRALEVGFEAHVTKPLDAAILIDTIRRIGAQSGTAASH